IIASNAGRNMAFAGVALALPTVLSGLLAAGMAWRESGSILPADWLPYAILLALLTAVLLAAGIPVGPSRTAVLAVAGLSGVALWSAVSAGRSPLPSAARREALLVAPHAAPAA